ncbi:hypothetical protein CC78DRAFT_579454 [Lojkania enalia]|uniref:Mediator of RNA polymerase II transcription subunit 12 n=1 Tax=Lojkania enalia TaxID=147567 RepID=A0A9P4KF49_9PLEO|nr:hypothetical protein CC78DRAFT_579454 [Didymosphaeria enalia]
MTSRPGPGIPEPLQQRGSGGHVRVHSRRPSRPSNIPQHLPLQDCIDPNLEADRRPTEETLTKPRAPTNTKPKLAPLDGIQIAAPESTRPPPRGMPQLFFSNLANIASDPWLQSPRGQPVNAGMNLPVPRRPGPSPAGDASQQRRHIPSFSTAKVEASARPLSSDASIPAVIFPGGSMAYHSPGQGFADPTILETADLFPWTGNHPEDIMSEALVKAGISNKAQIMNETNTARPSLWSNLKNKSGLSQLSSLFVQVLEKRQSCGRLTAPNAFKPPPRLTLRDSTRETWLHDLANPTVGLRRLSRTIPHGITGKALLEQCLNKNIPIPRALWLAKCVGINEMRSHKRKGQAGTITWVRGWTGSVEQFLENTISTIGQQDWKPRITYALQLATHLYKEHLLEEDHYLDWVLNNLETCSAERLFLWLLLASVYWRDLTSSRRRGKRLADSVLIHAQKLRRLEEEGQASPVQDFFESTIIKLLVTSPVCLLNPKVWDKYWANLDYIVQKRSHPQYSHIVADLNRRNKRLSPSDRMFNTTQDKTRRILQLLDSINYNVTVSIEQLATECMELMADPRSLMSMVLQWASTLYRDGSHRVYLTTRLLRRWSSLGFDIDDGILSHLRAVGSNTAYESRNVFRIIAELVRSKTFSIGKYLQWLIATGSVNQCQDFDSPSAWPLRLITEIPLTGNTEPVLNLRRTLLRGTNYSAEAEEQLLDEAEWAIQRQVPGLFDMDLFPDHQASVDTRALSTTVKLELGVWLRSQVASNVTIIDHVPTKDPSIEESGAVCMISVQDFNVVRSYLEEFDDLSILADVVGIVCTSLDSNVLASAADTINFNYKAFSAIGAFKSLFEKVTMKYITIRTIKFPEKELLLSLADLARTARVDGKLTQLLAYDLSRYELKNSVAACSPVSDNMADTMSTFIDADDEIDRILSSGTSIDQQIMTRVFAKIMLNLEEHSSKGSLQPENLSAWFCRLRSFDENAFEKILTGWLESVLVNRRIQSFLRTLPSLIASGCISMFQFLDISKRFISKRKSIDPSGTCQMSVEILEAVLPWDPTSKSPVTQYHYRYCLEQQKIYQDPEGRILQVVQGMVDTYSAQLSSSVKTQVTTMLCSDRLRKLVRYFAIQDTKMLAASLRIGKHSVPDETRANIKVLLDGLLDPGDHSNLCQKPLEQQISIVVESASVWSLPFCQLEIRQLFAIGMASPDVSIDSISAALLDSIKRAVEKDESPWSDLVVGLDGDLRNQICEHAEREILNASAFLNNNAILDCNRSTTEDGAFLRKYLMVIDLAASDSMKNSQNQAVLALVERLKGMSEALGRLYEKFKHNTHAGGVTASVTLLCTWLSALLRLTLIHDLVPSQKLGHQHQAQLLWSLRALFTHPLLQLFPSTAEYVFDVALFLSDSLLDDVRSHLSKIASGKAADDDRCTFIFGVGPSQDGWLALAKPVPAVNVQQASSPAQLQAQHLHIAHSTQQNPSHLSQMPGLASIQRSLNQQHQQQQTHAQGPPRAYPQYSQPPQHNKIIPQMQRMTSSPQPTQHQQLQQMQQMQGLAQQRNTQSSPMQLQRQATSSPQPSASTGKGSLGKQEKPEAKVLPFPLRRWEILPDSGGNPLANDTAISLSLFGARKV